MMRCWRTASVTLPILEKQIDAYIARAKADR